MCEIMLICFFTFWMNHYAKRQDSEEDVGCAFRYSLLFEFCVMAGDAMFVGGRTISTEDWTR